MLKSLYKNWVRPISINVIAAVVVFFFFPNTNKGSDVSQISSINSSPGATINQIQTKYEVQLNINIFLNVSHTTATRLDR